MAVDVCSSSEIPSLVSSPRISFSHYLTKTKTVPIEPPLFDFDFDFNFCIRNDDFTNLSSADEIFFNGKILPVGIKTQVAPPKGIEQCDATAVRERNANEKKKLKEFLCSSEFDEEDLKPLPKSSWKYRRSSTVNSESLRSKTLLRSLQFLSRSNSTGSSLNPKQTVVSKDNNQKQNPIKQSPVGLNSRSSPYSSGHCPPYNAPRRTSSMKNFRSNSNGVGVGFSPVLNIPYSCIDRGSVIMSLFGFGSLFSNAKAKKKKKK